MVCIQKKIQCDRLLIEKYRFMLKFGQVDNLVMFFRENIIRPKSRSKTFDDLCQLLSKNFMSSEVLINFIDLTYNPFK